MDPRDADGRPAAVVRALRRLGAAGSVLAPGFGWPPFLLLALRRRGPALGWAAAWLGFFLLSATPALLRGAWADLAVLALTCGGGYLASRIFVASRRDLHVGLAVVAVLVGTSATLGVVIYERTWKAPGENPATEVETSAAWGVDRVARPATYRLWRLPEGAASLVLSFEARSAGGTPGWSWRRSTTDVVATPLPQAEAPGARFEMPAGGDPWVSRRYDVGAGVESVRVSIGLRAPEGGQGRIYLLSDDEPVHVERIEVGDAWRSYTTTWRGADGERIDDLTLMLNDFDGRTLSVRNVVVDRRDGDGGWAPLGPPREAYASIALDRADRSSELGADRVRFLPGEAWRRIEATFDDERFAAMKDVRAILRLEPGTAVAVRRVALRDADSGARARPVTAEPRQRLWYAHPNVMGHAMAVAGIAILATTPAAPWAWSGAAFTALGVLHSGSRAALLVLVAAAFVLVWERAAARPRRRAQIGVVGAILLGAAVLFAATQGAERLAAGQSARAAVMATALDAMREHPWGGLGSDPGAFTAFWLERRGVEAEPVAHAHNWWLQAGASRGVPGFLAAVWFSLLLLRIGWRAGRWRGLTFVGAVLALQVVDVTLLQGVVLSPLVLTLNVMAEREAGASEEVAAGRIGGQE